MDVRAFSVVLEEVKPDVLVLRNQEWITLKRAAKLNMYEKIDTPEGLYQVLYRLK
jgi:hypothetical protein